MQSAVAVQLHQKILMAAVATQHHVSLTVAAVPMMLVVGQDGTYCVRSALVFAKHA
jgi:hypothetical protein